MSVPPFHHGPQVDKYQLELDRLSATLKQIEEYNEQMKSEIAATRRAAYAAEGAVSKLEKEKMEQDYRCVAACGPCNMLCFRSRVRPQLYKHPYQAVSIHKDA